MNPYEILNANENDKIEVIKSSYHKLLLQYHPDKRHNITNNNKKKEGETLKTTNNNTDMFLTIQEAWKMICDIENNPLLYKNINSDEVKFNELELMNVEDRMYVKQCRCGEVYEVYVEDLLENINTFQCNGCSLYITICDVPSEL